MSMNKYTWGTMVDDYTFLEEVGRRVGDWGKEIVQGGYSNNVGSEVSMRGNIIRGRGRGRGRGERGRGGNSKRDVLKLQLEQKDIEVDLLPLGMEKRKLNQSVWDLKCVCTIKSWFFNLNSTYIHIYSRKKTNCTFDDRIYIPQTQGPSRPCIPTT